MKGFISLVKKFRFYPIGKKEGRDIQRGEELASLILSQSLSFSGVRL